MSLPKGLNENRFFCAAKSLQLAEDQLKWANWAGNAWDIRISWDLVEDGTSHRALPPLDGG